MQPQVTAGSAKRSALLLRPNEELHSRIEARTLAMLGSGLIYEVRRLRAEGLEANSTEANATGWTALNHLDMIPDRGDGFDVDGK